MSDQEFSRHLEHLDRLAEVDLVGSYATEFTVGSASGLLDHLLTFGDHHWAFRGQADAKWGLKPSIERHARKGFWPAEEGKIYEEFRRRAGQYMQDGEQPADDLAWLATMRHFGAPTRLLDWTKDALVAAFFALADVTANETASAIWIINEAAISKEADRLISTPDPGIQPSQNSDAHFVETFFGSTWPPIAKTVTPSLPCTRQRKQKGIFLCSNGTQWGDDFEICLKNTLQNGIERAERWLYKITVKPGLRADVLTKLKSKGITYESIFPGLDGLGKSLEMDVRIGSDFFEHYYPSDSDDATN